MHIPSEALGFGVLILALTVPGVLFACLHRYLSHRAIMKHGYPPSAVVEEIKCSACNNGER